jgi:hypothetical protein
VTEQRRRAWTSARPGFTELSGGRLVPLRPCRANRAQAQPVRQRVRVERDEGLGRGKKGDAEDRVWFLKGKGVGERRGRQPIGHQWQGKRRR